jgi:hypothetical protein
MGNSGFGMSKDNGRNLVPEVKTKKKKDTSWLKNNKVTFE